MASFATDNAESVSQETMVSSEEGDKERYKTAWEHGKKEIEERKKVLVFHVKQNEKMKKEIELLNQENEQLKKKLKHLSTELVSMTEVKLLKLKNEQFKREQRERNARFNFNAVKRWVRESCSTLSYSDWNWDESEGILKIYCEDNVETYSRQTLIENGLELRPQEWNCDTADNSTSVATSASASLSQDTSVVDSQKASQESESQTFEVHFEVTMNGTVEISATSHLEACDRFRNGEVGWSLVNLNVDEVQEVNVLSTTDANGNEHEWY